MSRMRPPSLRRQLSLVALSAIAVGSCTLEQPFERVNPMDPGSIFAFDVAGPDSAHYIGEVLEFELLSEPALPSDDFNFVWRAMPHVACLPRGGSMCFVVDIPLAFPTGRGAITVTDATAEYRLMHVRVEFDRRHVSKEIYVGQRPVQLDLSCAPWSQAFDDCSAPRRRDTTLTLYPRMFDAGGAPLREPVFALPFGEFIVRNPALAVPLPRTVILSALDPLAQLRVQPTGGTGSTWIVVRMGVAWDSVLVTFAP